MSLLIGCGNLLAHQGAGAEARHQFGQHITGIASDLQQMASQSSQLPPHIVHRHFSPSKAVITGANKAPRAGQLQCGVVNVNRQQPSFVLISQRNGMTQGGVVVQA